VFCYNLTTADVTILAIGLTAGLAVGIVILLVVIAAYYNSRTSVDSLRKQISELKTERQQAKSTTSRVRISDDIIEVIRDRRRAAAAQRTTGFDLSNVSLCIVDPQVLVSPCETVSFKPARYIPVNLSVNNMH